MDDLPELLGFVLLVGFGGCLVVGAVLAGICRATSRSRFSWQIVLGISAALAVLGVIACFLWIAYIGNRTY